MCRMRLLRAEQSAACCLTGEPGSAVTLSEDLSGKCQLTASGGGTGLHLQCLLQEEVPKLVLAWVLVSKEAG